MIKDGHLWMLGTQYHDYNEEAVVVDQPTIVEAMQEITVVQVSAGPEHSLVLTESGEVYSFGEGQYGSLGHGDEEQQLVPKLIEMMRGKKVVQVSAGGLHNLVLTERGEVYSFGSGGHGKLGHGDEENQTRPKLIESMEGKRATQISASSTASFIVTESGEVFSFGRGCPIGFVRDGSGSGNLGHGDLKNVSLPKRIEALRGERVVQVSAGEMYCHFSADRKWQGLFFWLRR
jgi:alpha-tubulin suppressor-like RCC1 family protein